MNVMNLNVERTFHQKYLKKGRDLKFIYMLVIKSEKEYLHH